MPKESDRLIEVGKCINLLGGFHPTDRLRGHCHRADGLFVTFMSDVDDAVALGGSNLDFMMDFRDQGRTVPDDKPSRILCSLDNFWC